MKLFSCWVNTAPVVMCVAEDIPHRIAVHIDSDATVIVYVTSYKSERNSLD